MEGFLSLPPDPQTSFDYAHCWYRYSKREFPLHLALRCCASPKVIQLLVNAHPVVARECFPNWKGNTPLHIACQSNGKGRIVEPLIQCGTTTSKNAACMTNSKGELPLHIAASERSCTSKVVDAVLQLNPDAISEEIMTDPNHLGQTPKGFVSVVETRANPEKDTNNNNLPGIRARDSSSSLQATRPQRKKTTPLSLAIIQGSSKGTLLSLAHATRTKDKAAHAGGRDSLADLYAHEYFEMNYPRHYTSHAATKKALAVPKLPSAAWPTPLSLQRQIAERPSKLWSRLISSRPSRLVSSLLFSCFAVPLPHCL
jgi:hypothetical protein